MVTIDGVLYRALIDEPPPEADPRAKVVVQDRDVRLRWDGKVLRVVATWTVIAKENTWLNLGISGPGVRVDSVRIGERRADRSVQDGWTWITGEVGRRTKVVLEGAVEGDPSKGPLTLELAGAVYGTVSISAPKELEGKVAAADVVDLGGVFATAHTRLDVAVGPPLRKARDRRTLAMASTGVGLTVGDGAIVGRAQVRWVLRQGELTQVSLRVANVGSDLEVTGGNVGKVERQGDRVLITLREAERAVVDLDVSWSVPVPAGATATIPLPVVEPQGAFRTEASLQLARDGEIEALPELPGWQPISAESLPDWGDNLVQGTPTAAYTSATAGRGGNLGLLRYVPVPAPPVMVDVASLTIAASGEGRTLTRANYTVRNERASHLRVRPPSGAIIVGARVADGPVTPVLDGESWLIPLPRSLETVDGLLSFPVEVVLIGDGTPWVRAEERDIAVPMVDAPIAVHRVTLHLPPVFESTLEPGAAGTVDDFTEGEGIAYGFGLGDEKEAEADQLWQDAQAAYMRNDFDDADGLLDKLTDIGASNENLGKLRSNLDVVQGRADEKSKAANARRVKEQAKSRGQDDYRKQEDLWRGAEEELAAGNYEDAAVMYKEVEAIAEKLDKLEQDESFEQKARAAAASAGSSSASSGMQWQKSVEGYGTKALSDDLSGAKGNKIVIGGRGGAQETNASKRDEEQDRRWQSLVQEVEKDGVVTLAADGKDVAQNGVLGQYAAGAFDPNDQPTFVPSDGDESEVLNIAEEMDAELYGEEEGEIGGVAGGVVGGVLGGVSGAVMAGEVASDLIPGGRDFSTNVEVAESVRTVDRTRTIKTSGGANRGRGATGRRSGRSVDIARGPTSGKKGKRKPASPMVAAKPMPSADQAPVEPATEDSGARERVKFLETTTIDFEGDSISGELTKPDGNYALEALEVTSTRLSVVVPVLGQTLRFQHLLLPAGQAHSVRVEARADHTVPRRLP